MFTGSVTINGVTDKDLVKILEIKIKHERILNFNPQQMQQAPNQGNQTPLYNNVILSWSNEQGLEAVHEIISILLKKEERKGQAA